MRILFDHGTPSGIARELAGHEVTEAIERGWDRIVVLGNSKWRIVRLYLDRVTLAVNAATPGSYAEVEIPFT
jgi:hypothetical protein